MSRSIVAAALVGLLGWSGSALAAQNCRITAPALLFGDYEAASQIPVDSASSLAVRCVGRPVGAFTVSVGTGTSGDMGRRTLRVGSETLVYNLFVDAARTRVWGDGTAGTERLTVTPPPQSTGRPRELSLPVYGRIPAGQDPAPGLYTDTLVITVEF